MSATLHKCKRLVSYPVTGLHVVSCLYTQLSQLQLSHCLTFIWLWAASDCLDGLCQHQFDINAAKALLPAGQLQELSCKCRKPLAASSTSSVFTSTLSRWAWYMIYTGLLRLRSLSLPCADVHKVQLLRVHHQEPAYICRLCSLLSRYMSALKEVSLRIMLRPALLAGSRL